MVKRLLRRQLVDTPHTKRSERLFPLLKSSLRDDGGGAEGHCGSVIAGPRTAGWIAARSPAAGVSAKPELVCSNFLSCGRQPDVKGAALTFLAAHLK
jgi:hypothetical protein